MLLNNAKIIIYSFVTQLTINTNNFCASHLALNFPRLCDCGQVTCGHHHGPETENSLQPQRNVQEQVTLCMLAALT